MLLGFVLFVVSIVIFLVIVTAIGHLIVSTPYGGTSAAVAHTMLRLADIHDGDTVMDIGAGDGRLLIAAKRAHPTIRSEGYEIALGIWMLGKIRIFLSRLAVTLHLRNALKDDLSRADVIFLYVGPQMMCALLPKFDRELRPGTRVVSHAYRFHERDAFTEEQVPSGRRVKKVYLYRW